MAYGGNHLEIGAPHVRTKGGYQLLRCVLHRTSVLQNGERVMNGMGTGLECQSSKECAPLPLCITPIMHMVSLFACVDVFPFDKLE